MADHEDRAGGQQYGQSQRGNQGMQTQSGNGQDSGGGILGPNPLHRKLTQKKNTTGKGSPVMNRPASGPTSPPSWTTTDDSVENSLRRAYLRPSAPSAGTARIDALLAELAEVLRNRQPPPPPPPQARSRSHLHSP